MNTAASQLRPRIRRAFTLIEVLVVLGLILILASIGIGVNVKMVKSYEAASAPNQVIAAISEARMLAMQQQREVIVIFRQIATHDENSGSFAEGDTYYEFAYSKPDWDAASAYYVRVEGTQPQKLPSRMSVRAPNPQFTPGDLVAAVQPGKSRDGYNQYQYNNLYETYNPAAQYLHPPQVAVAIGFSPSGNLLTGGSFSYDGNANGTTYYRQGAVVYQFVEEPTDITQERGKITPFIAIVEMDKLIDARRVADPQQAVDPAVWDEDAWVRSTGKYFTFNRYSGNVIELKRS